MFRNRYSKRMRLYHGSDQIVREPRILEPNRQMDFGRGFYTTDSRKQAERWSRVVRDRHEGSRSFVSEYEYEESDGLKVLIFDGPTEEWFDFVEFNRMGVSIHDYDIVIGPVADEGVFKVLFRYEQGYLTKEQTIQQLEAAKLDGQVLFHTDKSLGCLRYIGYWEVE